MPRPKVILMMVGLTLLTLLVTVGALYPRYAVSASLSPKRASPVGSTEYCLMTKTGNCTDFHSLYASLSRSAGIPTQIIYGSLLKPTLNGLDVDASYHCWVQIFAPNIGWVTKEWTRKFTYKELPQS